jgi:hypothetical protein
MGSVGEFTVVVLLAVPVLAASVARKREESWLALRQGWHNRAGR